MTKLLALGLPSWPAIDVVVLVTSRMGSIGPRTVGSVPHLGELSVAA